MERTNPRQFEVQILGQRRPAIGEVFEIETPRHQRIEVECIERRGVTALVERTDGGPAMLEEIRSRVISELKVAPPDLRYGERSFAHATAKEMPASIQAERDWDDHQASLFESLSDTEAER